MLELSESVITVTSEALLSPESFIPLKSRLASKNFEVFKASMLNNLRAQSNKNTLTPSYAKPYL